VREILEGILKGLLQWIYDLILEIVEYAANGLIDVFSMDLSYFQSAMPVADDILNIIIAAGWALLLGNLIFQAAKSMMSGLGFEGEDPKTLFARTFVFAFFLLASRQICSIGLGAHVRVNVPDDVPECRFSENAAERNGYYPLRAWRRAVAHIRCRYYADSEKTR
jgi:hypothetical protein